MQPLHCKICRVTLNAPAQAKQHYEGKNHSRKLKMFMEGKAESEKDGKEQVSNVPMETEFSIPPSFTILDLYSVLSGRAMVRGFLVT